MNCIFCKKKDEQANNTKYGWVCNHTDCQTAYKNRLALDARFQQWLSFFLTHDNSEDSYKEYFELANLESAFQKTQMPLVALGQTTSRRSWFQHNISSVHGWVDEFNRVVGSHEEIYPCTTKEKTITTIKLFEQHGKKLPPDLYASVAANIQRYTEVWDIDDFALGKIELPINDIN